MVKEVVEGGHDAGIWVTHERFFLSLFRHFLLHGKTRDFSYQFYLYNKICIHTDITVITPSNTSEVYVLCKS